MDGWMDRWTNRLVAAGWNGGASSFVKSVMFSCDQSRLKALGVRSMEVLTHHQIVSLHGPKGSG